MRSCGRRAAARTATEMNPTLPPAARQSSGGDFIFVTKWLRSIRSSDAGRICARVRSAAEQRAVINIVHAIVSSNPQTSFVNQPGVLTYARGHTDASRSENVVRKCKSDNSQVQLSAGSQRAPRPLPAVSVPASLRAQKWTSHAVLPVAGSLACLLMMRSCR